MASSFRFLSSTWPAVVIAIPLGRALRLQVCSLDTSATRVPRYATSHGRLKTLFQKSPSLVFRSMMPKPRLGPYICPEIGRRSLVVEVPVVRPLLEPRL